METVGLLVLAWVISLAINIVPGFMPPTWSVLAVFHVAWGVPLLPLTIGGPAFSAAGRVLLALGSRKLSRWLPKKDQENACALGEFVERHRNWRIGIVFLYCLGPFPSNALFIAAGVGRVPLLAVTAAFFVSRVIADTLWVWLAAKASASIGDVFGGQLTSWPAIVVQVAALVSVVLVLRLPWAKWLHGDKRAPERARKGARPQRGRAQAAESKQ